MKRNIFYAAALFALTYAASFYFRIYVVDTPVGGAGGNAVTSALRQGVLWGQLNGAWGLACLASGVVTLLVRGRALVFVWAVLTAMALSNYNGDYGVIGLALGLLRLVRP